MQSRLLLVFAVLPRVLRDYAEEGSRFDLYLHALSSLTEAGTNDAASELYRKLVDDDLFPSIEAWGALIDEITRPIDLRLDKGDTEIGDDDVREVHLAVRSLTNQPPPCSGSLSWEPDKAHENTLGADKDPVARLWAHVCVDSITDEAAAKFMDPEQWPHCTPFYVGMTKRGPAAGGGDCYLEDLSVDQTDQSIEHLKVCLVFTKVVDPDGTIALHYDLATANSGCPDCVAEDQGKIVVDHGDIEIRKREPSGYCFTSTKYYRFADIVDGGATAMFICAVGYAAQVEDYLHTCYAQDNGGVGPKDVGGMPAGPLDEREEVDGGDEGEDEIVIDDATNVIDIEDIITDD
jgi:hypothetical protein